MWDVLVRNNGGVKINKEKSFFCGDAAGRKNGKVKDFSDSDLKFALNVGI
jgi:bifunctional polynucleotide phosphatase/kinase